MGKIKRGEEFCEHGKDLFDKCRHCALMFSHKTKAGKKRVEEALKDDKKRGKKSKS